MALYKKVSANRAMQTGKRVPLNDEGLPIDRGLPAVPRGLNREMTAYLQSLHNVVLSMTGLGRGTTDTRAVRVTERVAANAGGASLSVKDFLDVGSILETHIANGAITEAKIADGAVTHSKLGPSSVEGINIKPEAVDAATIKAMAVITEKLADGAVTTDKLADEAVTTGKIADGAVVTDKLEDEAVATQKLADGAVTAEKIADCSITWEKLDPELLPVAINGIAEHGEIVNLGKWLEMPLVAMTGQKIPVGECGELCVGIENLREENGAWLFDAVAVFEMGDGDTANCYPGQISWMAVGRRKKNG